MDIHLLCLAVCRSRPNVPIDSMEYGNQPTCGLHYCELTIHLNRGLELTLQANSLKEASIVRARPKKGKGKGEMIPLESKTVSQAGLLAVKSLMT